MRWQPLWTSRFPALAFFFVAEGYLIDLLGLGA